MHGQIDDPGGESSLFIIQISPTIFGPPPSKMGQNSTQQSGMRTLPRGVFSPFKIKTFARESLLSVATLQEL